MLSEAVWPTLKPACGAPLRKVKPVRRALTLAKAGAGLNEAAKAAGVFWKQEREFLRQARSWSLEELDRIQPEILNADRLCKTAGAPDHLIAERLALQVAGRARRLGL